MQNQKQNRKHKASMGLALKSEKPPINHLDIVTLPYGILIQHTKDIHTSQLGKIEYIIQISDNNKNKKKQQIYIIITRK